MVEHRCWLIGGVQSWTMTKSLFSSVRVRPVSCEPLGPSVLSEKAAVWSVRRPTTIWGAENSTACVSCGSRLYLYTRPLVGGVS